MTGVSMVGGAQRANRKLRPWANGLAPTCLAERRVGDRRSTAGVDSLCTRSGHLTGKKG